MILPMFGFILALLVIGGLATLIAVGDPNHAGLAPYVGFVSLFAGLGALSCSLLLALIGQGIKSETLSGFGFFAGYAVGGLGGAAIGLYSAVQRRQRLVTPIINEPSKHPLNVSGKYYVSPWCLDHECCVETAPNNFRMGEDRSAYVFKQPATPEEEAQCKRALEECPVDSIRDDGELNQ